MIDRRRQHFRSVSIHARRNAAFTLTELIVVIGLITVLTAIALPVYSHVRAAQRSVKCLTNLRQIDVALKAYAADNGVLPDPQSTQTSWEALLQPYAMTGDLYLCPADAEVGPTTGSSYDWRDTGDTKTTLAGRRLESARPDAVLVFDSLPEWHATGKMNAVQVNGMAAEMDQGACIDDLEKSYAR